MAQKNLSKLYPKIEGDSKFGFKYLSFISSDTAFASSGGLSGAAVEGQLRYDSSEHNFKYWNGSADTAVAVASSSSTGLDAAYDLGVTIVVDAGAVTLAANGSAGLSITEATNHVPLAINKAGTGAGALIDLTNSGTGYDIDGTSSTWYVTKAGAATFTTIAGTDLTLTSSTVSITTDLTDTVAVSLEMDTLTTGTALEIDADAGAGCKLIDLQNASTSVMTVGGTGIVTLAGVAKDAATLILTAGDITVTAGDIDITSGQFSMTTDGAGDGMVLTDLAAQNNDLLYLNGTNCAGSGNILKIDQGAAARTGNMVDLNMGQTATGMAAIDISCTGGTRTVPVINIDSDGTASDFIKCITSVVFTGNMIDLVQDTAAGTGNFIFINNDTGTSMEAINIDDEANTADIILVNATANTGAGKALVHLVSDGTPNATGNALFIDWTGITATNTPYAVNVSTTGKDSGALVITSGAATDSTVAITGSGAIADNKAILELIGTGTPAAAGSNLLRVDGTGLTATNVPTLVEIAGGGKTVQGLNIDADCTSVPVVLINGGGALTDGLGVVNLTNDGNLATGGNVLNVTMGGTPHSAAAAVEISAAKDAYALYIASSAATNSGVYITNNGAVANNKAVLEVVATGTPANAGSNIVRIDGSGITDTNKPIALEIDTHGKDAPGLFIDSDSATASAVLINGGGAVADNKGVLHVTADGALVAGSAIVRIEGSAAAGGATAYGLEIACNANNLEGLFVSAGTSLFTEAVTFTAGQQSSAVARTATADGTGTGAIAAGTTFVAVTAGADANSIITLPAPVVGNIIWLYVGATGYELRSSDPATIAINGGSGAGAESAVGANVLVRAICTSATTWVCSTFAADGTEAKLEAAAA